MFRFLSIVLLSLLNCGLAQAGVTVRLNTPANGARPVTPATVTISSTARATADGEALTAHRLLRDGVIFATETPSGTPHTMSRTLVLGVGTYTFQSGASSNHGGGAVSAVHTITVIEPGGNPPTVSLGVPAGAPFIAPASVGLSATGSDDAGIAKVEFLANGTLIGTDTTAPYELTWNNVAAGSYSITAKATDTNNLSTTSSPQAVTITTSAIKGNIDGVSMSGDQYVVTGWACSTGRNDPINVHLYAGGQAGSGVYVGAYSASLGSEPPVAAACQAQGTQYRFNIPLPASVRQQHANKPIYLHGISPVGADNSLIDNSGVYIVPAPLAQTRNYTYDAHQRLCKSVEPETGATLYGYDAAGNLAWTASGLPADIACEADGTSPAVDLRRVDRLYDARNRLQELSFPDGRGDQSWEYTPDGLPRHVRTVNVVGANNIDNAWEYNARRMLKTESQLLPAWYINMLTYGYDRNGSLQTLHYPSGQTVEYAPNALGQATQAGVYASNITYHPNGTVAGFTYGNGITFAMTQNPRQLPARTTHSGVLDFGYNYDGQGNILGITDHLSGRQTRMMIYDGLDRLRTTSSPMFGDAAYGYDGLDNLTRVSIGGAHARDRHYCYDAGRRLTNVKTGGCGGTTVIGLGYDAQGNVTNKNGQRFDFDYGNRLREVIGAERYRYDAYGRRILATNFGSGIVFSQYGQGGQLLYQYNERTGQMKRIDHIWLAGSLIAQREEPIGGGAVSVKYQHTDALGSPVAVTNGAGQWVESSEYEPFGQPLNRPGHDRPGYTGHVEDAATGLVQAQQRFYDPMIGLFLSVDPVTALSDPLGQFHRYRYANGNPYKFFDPDGRQSRCTGTRIESACGTSGTSGNAEENFNASAGTQGVHRPLTTGQKIRADFDIMVRSSPLGPGGKDGARYFFDDAVAGVGDVVDGNLRSAAENFAVGLFFKRLGPLADKFSRAPKSLMDQLVLDGAKSGKGIKIMDNLKDPQFRGMQKWSYTEKSKLGHRSEVHYVRDPISGDLMDFKFKIHNETYR